MQVARSSSSVVVSSTDNIGSLWFDHRGLHLGAITLSARPFETEHDSLPVYLAVVFGKRLNEPTMRALKSAAIISRSGDHALANIHLALARLNRPAATHDLETRFGLVDLLVSKGMRPASILLALEADAGINKQYNPDQPRVPAGHHRESGRFGDGSGGQSAPPGAAAVAVALGGALARNAPAWSFLSAEVSAVALEALAGLAATVGSAAVLGVLFVPSPNAILSSGSLPNDPTTTYDYNQDDGVLRVKDADGVVVAAGQKDKAGIFHDQNTGIPFARALDGSIAFDKDAVAGKDAGALVKPAEKEKAEEDDEEREPKLCPPATVDVYNKPSPRARAYQEQISRLINPQRPLPYEWTPAFFNPVTGKWVRPDECDEKDGSLIDAKGPGYDGLLSFPEGNANVRDNFLGQAERQIEASQGRRVRWYFAEVGAAAFATTLFSEYPKLARVEINVVRAAL